jgi:hypothetical protein
MQVVDKKYFDAVAMNLDEDKILVGWCRGKAAIRLR